jgi:hypothetical protein
MVSTQRGFRHAGWLLVVVSLLACGNDDDIPPPGSAGQACNPDAIGTDGCDETSVCVVQTGVCHADCAQEACTGKCSRYFSPIIENSFSVCFSAEEAVPGERTGANPRPL